ncbi:adenylyltransferase/cytidyltransferase family protein [uncultured Litoreibacter sp.]|uniref:adenylyltransferase/cytidyltransferase family protein n=1 Tax=uncultured Litoreibacter sp. TaxID=1392394 RepID=UPI002638A204|nr:adenylyltransferase/cytidyltransferase family protein [uncultured Litoreibacter sp.]
MESKDKVVLTYGTFDMFHVGHVRLLERLSYFGDRLIVGLSTDDFNARKGKKAVISYEDRASILRSCRFVEEVVPEKCWSQKVLDIRRFNVDVFGMGDDWQGEFDSLKSLCQVVYLPRTIDVSTTEIRANVLRHSA